MGSDFVDNQAETFDQFEKRTDNRTLTQKIIDQPMSAISGLSLIHI